MRPLGPNRNGEHYYSPVAKLQLAYGCPATFNPGATSHEAAVVQTAPNCKHANAVLEVVVVVVANALVVAQLELVHQASC